MFEFLIVKRQALYSLCCRSVKQGTRSVLWKLLQTFKPCIVCWRGSMAEQLTCNQQVAGSTPVASSTKFFSFGAAACIGKQTNPNCSNIFPFLCDVCCCVVRESQIFIWVGGEVGESRRTVNPFLIGEWVRLPPCPPLCRR